MSETLVQINGVVSLILLPMIIVAIVKGRWKYVKYLWFCIAVLGTVSLATELYIGLPMIQLVVSLVFVGFALLNTYSAWKPRKTG